MKLANRIGAAVLATAMVGTLLTGCGGGSASTTASTGDGTAAASSTESSGDGDNTYTMFMRSTYVDWIKELKWYDVAEERTGIHVDYISGPEEFNDVYSEIDQRVISGDLPDAVMTKLAQTNVYGPQGVFADLAPYIEKYAPNLQKYIDDNPDYKALVTDKDGHIYGLCKETPIFADLIGYRVDQFKAAGIDPDSIVTIDDFTKALETLKAYYGKDNPNYYPLTGRDNRHPLCFVVRRSQQYLFYRVQRHLYQRPLQGWLYRHYERWRLQDGRDHEEVVRRGPDPARMGRRYFR